MGIKVADNGGNFTPAPEGLFQAVCVDVIDIGIKDTTWGQKHKVQLRWQLDQIDPEAKPPKRFLVVKSYTASLNEKASLRKDLETWRAKKFTKEELEGFDLEVLLGINCQLQISHNVNDAGKTYANIGAIVPLGKGMTKLKPADYVRAVDRQAGEGAPSETADEEPAF